MSLEKCTKDIGVAIAAIVSEMQHRLFEQAPDTGVDLARIPLLRLVPVRECV